MSEPKRCMQAVLAGFGGQGILFAGKIIANAGLLEDRELSWLPSYGPEMRGGTANCSVCISDDPIGSPLVLNPDVLVVMNQPSLDKFEHSVQPGGLVIVDSTLVPRIPDMPGVTVCAVQPGDIHTGFTAAREKTIDGDDVYGGRISRSVARMEHDEQTGMDPAKAGAFIAKVAMKRRVKPIYTIRFDYQFLALLTRILPYRFLNWLIGVIYGK